MSDEQQAGAPTDDRIITAGNDEVVVALVGGALLQGSTLRIGVVCETDMQRRALSKGVVALLEKGFGSVETARKGTAIFGWRGGPPVGKDPWIRFLVLSEAVTGGKLDLVIKATEKRGDPRWWRDLGHRLASRPSTGEG